MAPTITSPLRLLLLSTPSTPSPSLFHESTTHHPLSTPYYTASIPIWRDTLPTTISDPHLTSWKTEWTSPEAGEVVQAVGAWVVLFRKPRVKDDLDSIRDSLKTIQEVVEHHDSSTGGWSGDSGTGGPLLLAVGMRQSVSPSLEMGGEEWEDFCRECGVGWEWIDGEIGEGREGEGEKEGRNEFGEKVGIARLREALEAHEWDAGVGDGDGDVDFDELEEELGVEDGFGAEAAEVERELVGLKMAVRRVGGKDGEEEEEEEEEGADEGVEELENMMLKMQAIKDMGADMPEGERRKFAARAVRDVMKTM